MSAWKKGPDGYHCANCGYTWDMHLCDGNTSCPSPRPLTRYRHSADYMLRDEAGPWVSSFDAQIEIERLEALLNQSRAECARLRDGLRVIATDEHRLMSITARQTAESILDGKPAHGRSDGDIA
jgi:hypothetical protein